MRHVIVAAIGSVGLYHPWPLTVTHLKIGCEKMKPTETRPSNDLQWLDYFVINYHSSAHINHQSIGDIGDVCYFRKWYPPCTYNRLWGGWGCEVSCGGHHRPRGKTTMGSALDGAVFDIAQILAYLVHNMSRSQLYLGFCHFVWLPSFFGQ